MALKLNSLVELLDQYSAVYPNSATGARGFVRARRELPKSEPEIYVEWDKIHWRYHGERDGWTFEHHFREVSAGPDPEPLPSLVQNMLTEASARVDAERCPECGDVHDDEGDIFLDELARGQEAALESDGFLIVAVRAEPTEDGIKFIPSLHSYTLTPDIKALLETQLVDFAAQILERDLVRRIQGDNESGR